MFRRKGQEFTPEQRAFMLGALGAGATQQRVAAALGTVGQRVSEQLQRTLRHRTTRNLPRSGRPRERVGGGAAGAGMGMGALW